MTDISSESKLATLPERQEAAALEVEDVDFVDEESKFSLRAYLVASLEQAVILFGIYVLSIGPMYWTWLRSKHVDGNFLVAAFYEPLWVLGGLIPPFGEWLNWYVKLWNL